MLMLQMPVTIPLVTNLHQRVTLVPTVKHVQNHLQRVIKFKKYRKNNKENRQQIKESAPSDDKSSDDELFSKWDSRSVFKTKGICVIVDDSYDLTVLNSDQLINVSDLSPFKQKIDKKIYIHRIHQLLATLS